MNNKYLLPYLLAALVISNLCNAQMPADFQFLDHSWINTDAKQIVVEADKIYFTSQNGINDASYDYKLNRKTRGTVLQSKLITTNDSTFHLLQWEREGGDVSGIPGFDYLTKTGTEEKSATILQNILKPTFHPVDITNDSLGGWWCLGSDHFTSSHRPSKIYHIVNDQITEKLENELIFNSSIFTNSLGDIYTYAKGRGELHYFSGSDFILIEEFYDIYPSDISLWKGNNLLIDFDQVFLTDPKFTELLHTWKLPKSPKSFDELQITADSSLYIKIVNDASYTITKISKDSEILFSYSAIAEDDETLTGVYVLTDTTQLLYGQHHFSFSNNLFFRHINTTKTIDYPTSKVALERFGVIPDTASIFGEKNIALELTLKNNGAEPMHKTNAYSNIFITNPNIATWQLPFIGLDIRDTIPIGQAINFSSSFRYFEFDYSALTLEIPGANYKFNISPDKLRNVDYISAINEPTDFKTLTIYPNPTHDFITLPFDIKEVLIYNTDGQLVFQKKNLRREQEINVSELEVGLYYVVLIDTDNSRKVGKVVKKN